MNTSNQVENFKQLADACKALSHPARLAILKLLAERGTCVCGEVVEVMPLSQATVSQHLKVLKQAGLISGTVSGPATCYCINDKAMAVLRGEIENLFGSLENCC